MTLRVEPVDWLDPRAVALRDAMGIETGAVYADLQTALPEPQQAAIVDSLAVSAADVVETIIVRDGGEPVGHAALRPFGHGPFAHALEVKKVFVPLEHRGRGISRLMMEYLEGSARGRGATSLVLQTGTLQLAAIALYERLGYVPIPVYGAYTAIPFALCFEKKL